MRSIADLDKELYAAIDERRADRRVEEEPRGDVLSLLLRARYEDGDPMGDKELRDELVTLLVAGHETTSGALALAIEEIVRKPEVIEGIRAEARREEEIYLEAVVREALRRKPVLPIIGRKLTAHARLGAMCCRGEPCCCRPIYLLHHEPGIYPDPGEFRPERFLGPLPGPTPGFRSAVGSGAVSAPASPCSDDGGAERDVRAARSACRRRARARQPPQCFCRARQGRPGDR